MGVSQAHGPSCYAHAMLQVAKRQISNDPLWAVLAGLGGAACISLYLFGGLEPETAAEVKGWGEALGGFMVMAIGRWRVESGGSDA